MIATGRNAATKLAHLKETGAAILDLDVTIPEAEVFAKIKEARQIYGRIDVLVNNAGYIESGAVEDISYVHFAAGFSRTLDADGLLGSIGYIDL